MAISGALGQCAGKSVGAPLKAGFLKKQWGAQDLFAGGDEGATYILSPSNMFTDRAGTTPVTALDDFVGYITDSSGNANDLVAVSDAGRALYKTDGTDGWIQLDKVDDNYSTTFASPIVGTMLIGTRKGTIHLEVDIPAGAWSLTTVPTLFPGDTITDIIIKNVYMTAAELANAKAWLASRGSPSTYTPTGTDLVSGLRFRSDLTDVIFDNWDASSVTSISAMLRDSSGLTTIDISNLDLSSNTNATQVCYSCANLSSVIGSAVLSSSPCVNYTGSFFNTNLTQQSIDDILVAINAAGTSGGTFNQSGGSAPSATGNAAIDALRVRGWTVTVTGGY